jgi:hypothetical protein
MARLTDRFGLGLVEHRGGLAACRRFVSAISFADAR